MQSQRRREGRRTSQGKERKHRHSTPPHCGTADGVHAVHGPLGTLLRMHFLLRFAGKKVSERRATADLLRQQNGIKSPPLPRERLPALLRASARFSDHFRSLPLFQQQPQQPDGGNDCAYSHYPQPRRFGGCGSHSVSNGLRLLGTSIRGVACVRRLG